MLTKLTLQRLEYLRQNHLERNLYPISHRQGKIVTYGSKNLLNFTSNDYLGLAGSKRVQAAFICGVNQFGAGSSASALVSGYYLPQQQLEQQMAEFLNCEQAMLFNSGYIANLSVIEALAKQNSTIILDRLCHASIIDGVKLSRARFMRYRHNNVPHAKYMLSKSTGNKMLISETIFSMEGDIAPVQALASIAEEHDATLIIDDAHGFGIIGEKGAGASEYLTASNYKQNLCLIIPLGKALGTQGAIVGGSSSLITYLRQTARGYVYSTAQAPALAYASLTALRILQDEHFRRDKLRELIVHFTELAAELNLTLISTELTPIKSILVGDNKLALKIAGRALEQGMLISCIRPPTVQVGEARIRISLNYNHDKEDITRLLEVIQKELVK
jgi:8-amino-7-oxononanoate synthase